MTGLHYPRRCSNHGGSALLLAMQSQEDKCTQMIFRSIRHLSSRNIPKPRRLATFGQARAYIDEALRRGRSPPKTCSFLPTGHRDTTATPEPEWRLGIEASWCDPIGSARLQFWRSSALSQAVSRARASALFSTGPARNGGITIMSQSPQTNRPRDEDPRDSVSSDLIARWRCQSPRLRCYWGEQIQCGAMANALANAAARALSRTQ
jgi:hypothetical protein